jgi:hypothetical protein
LEGREFITYLSLQYGDWKCLRIQFWVKDLGIREKKSIYSEELYERTLHIILWRQNDGTCSTLSGNEQFWSGNSKVRRHVGDLGIDMRILLKCR